jgi:hypothetical protein
MVALISHKQEMRAYSKNQTIVMVVVISCIVLVAAYLTIISGRAQPQQQTPSISTSNQTAVSTTSSSEASSSCKNCIVISTVYLNIVSQGIDSSCWNQGVGILTQNLGEALGPNSPSREFSYSFSFSGNTMNDMQGVGNCDAGPTVEGFSITPSSSQLTITSVLPSLPLTISPGTDVQFTLYFDASQEAYSGPITIEMQLA